MIQYDDREFKTPVKDGAGKTPIWNFELRFQVKTDVSMKFTVWDKDITSSDLIAEADINPESIIPEGDDETVAKESEIPL